MAIKGRRVFGSAALFLSAPPTTGVGAGLGTQGSPQSNLTIVLPCLWADKTG